MSKFLDSVLAGSNRMNLAEKYGDRNFSFVELLTNFLPKNLSAGNELEGNVPMGVGTLPEGDAVSVQMPDSNGSHTPAFKVHLNAPSSYVGESVLIQRNDEEAINSIDVGWKDATLLIPQDNAPVFSRNLSPNLTNAGLESYCQREFPMDLYASSVVEPKYKKPKRKETASGIEDLCGKASDKGPQGMPMSDRSNASRKCRIKGMKASSKCEKTPVGGSLLLSFTPGCAIPAIETLVTTFSRYGRLKVSEIEIIDESSIRVPYERSSEARFAFQHLERSKPFGESLATSELDCPAVVVKRSKRSSMSMLGAHGSSTKPPGVAFMRRNMEMMKSTLENAGANLSPEVKAKLQNEINSFLGKISGPSQKGTVGSKSSVEGEAKVRVYTRRNMISGQVKRSSSLPH